MTTPTESGQAGSMPDWWLFLGTGRPRRYLDLGVQMPPPPPWRTFDGGPHLAPPPTDDVESTRFLGGALLRDPEAPLSADRHRIIDKVNAALLLRRPLLLTGPPGVGKSSLAHQVSQELGLGRVLRWPVNSRSSVASGLYEYDPITQIHDLNLENARSRVLGADDRRYAEGGEKRAHLRSSAETIGRYLRLGPLGTAFLPYALPRVLLIDDFDLGDFDLANDLVDLFENGGYRVPELARLEGAAETIEVATDDPGVRAPVTRGRVLCSAFPLTIVTCDNDRDLPAAFLRRCIPVHMGMPGEEELLEVVASHFGGYPPRGTPDLVDEFLRRGAEGSTLALDQLLNAVQMVSEVNNGSSAPTPDQVRYLAEMLWHRLRDDRG